MSIPLVVNGVTFNYPEVGDTDWGPEATDWAAAITAGTLQKSGGLFQLLDEVDFGSSHGLKSLFFEGRTSNPAATGTYRMARTDFIAWRNNANDADLALTVNASNQLLFAGVPIVGAEVTVESTASIALTLDVINLTADLILSEESADADNQLVTLEIKTDGLKAQIENAQIASITASSVVPAGAILPFGGASAPSGFLLCDGSQVLRSTYSTLYGVVGNAFGSGNGTTTFHLPDLRGRFVRGVDGAAGRDPDSSSRTASNSGGNTGNAIGTLQGEQLKSHNHTQDSHNHTQDSHNHAQDSHNHAQIAHNHTQVPHDHSFNNAQKFNGAGGGASNLFTRSDLGTNLTILPATAINIEATATNIQAIATNIQAIATNIQATATNQAFGGNETRPLNIDLNYIIKY